jgi:23S rRNA (uridine2552-2'-O)-methyltransferase
MAKPYDPKDFYYRKAKKAGLRARSAFKIDEILRRHRLLRKGQAVLDLGAAPGGFLQILADEVGETGVAVGVDLEPIRRLGKPWVKTAIVDLLAPDALDAIRALHPGPFQLVTSDMAPKTIGVKITDEARSLELVRMALSVAEETLAPGGAFVAKVFMGGEFPVLKKELAARFDEVHVIRPEAVRESSYEVYVLGKGLKRQGVAKSTPTPTSTSTPTSTPTATARSTERSISKPGTKRPDGSPPKRSAKDRAR